MTKKPFNPKQRENTWNNDAKFAEVRLNKADSDAFSAWLTNAAPSGIECLGWMCDDSYRVSVKYDYHNNCYVCSLTQQDPKHRNNGLVIVSRADSAETAIQMSLYKIEVMFQGQRLPDSSENGNSWG